MKNKLIALILLFVALFAGVTSAQAGNRYSGRGGRGNGSLHIYIGGLGYGCYGYPNYYGNYPYNIVEIPTYPQQQIVYQQPQEVVYVQQAAQTPVAPIAQPAPVQDIQPLPMLLGPDGTIYKQVRQADGSIALYPQGNVKAPAK